MRGPGHQRSQVADDSANASGTAEGMLGICTMTARAEGQFPASGHFQTRDVRVQAVQQELQETTQGETDGRSSGDLQSVSLAQCDEADNVCSASLLATHPGPGEQLEPLPASVPEGSTRRPMGVLQYTQQSREFLMRRGRSR